MPFLFLGVRGAHLKDMEIPGLGVELELQLLAYTTATATPDPSCVCNLHHSSQQCQFLTPLSEARDQTCIFMDNSWVLIQLSQPQGELPVLFFSLLTRCSTMTYRRHSVSVCIQGPFMTHLLWKRPHSKLRPKLRRTGSSHSEFPNYGPEAKSIGCLFCCCSLTALLRYNVTTTNFSSAIFINSFTGTETHPFLHVLSECFLTITQTDFSG